MRRLVAQCLLPALMLWVALPALAADEAKCAAAWLKADANGDGILQGEEAVNLVPQGTGTETPIQMTESEFMDTCKKGYFDTLLSG